MISLIGKMPQRPGIKEIFSLRAFPKNIFTPAGLKSFTLIEILIVVVILGVIAGLAIPNFSNLNTQIQLKETAKNISYLMRYAQSRAITKEKTQELFLDIQNAQYQLSEETGDAASSESEREFSPIPGRLGRTFEIPKEVTVETQTPRIYFYPDGKMGRVRIYFYDNRGHYMTVSTKEQAGYVQMFDFKVE